MRVCLKRKSSNHPITETTTPTTTTTTTESTNQEIPPQNGIDTIAENSESSIRHFIRSIQRGGAVHSADVFQPGDEVLEVNGIKLYGESHEFVLHQLRHLPSHVRMVCARWHNNNINNNSSTLDSSGPPFSHQEATSSGQSSPGGSYISDLTNISYLKRRFTTLSTRRYNPSQLSSPYGPRRSYTDGEVASMASTYAASEYPDTTEYAPFESDAFVEGDHLNSKRLTDGIVEWSSEPILIQLIKKDQGLGFTIVLHQDTIIQNHRHHNNNNNNNNNKKFYRVLIYSIEKGGLASQDGRLSVCDQIIFVNDRSLDDITTVKEASDILRRTRGKVILGIKKPLITKNLKTFTGDDNPNGGDTVDHDLLPSSSSSINDEVKRRFISDEELINCPAFPKKLIQCLIVERKCPSLGWIITSTITNCCLHGFRIRDILEDGDIYRDGRLKEGDFILGVNEESLCTDKFKNTHAFMEFCNRFDDCREDIVISFIPEMDAARFARQRHSNNGNHSRHSDAVVPCESANLIVDVNVNGKREEVEEEEDEREINEFLMPETTQTFHVSLKRTKPNASLGLSIVGPRLSAHSTTSDEDQVAVEHNDHIIIEHVKENSPASQCGQLRQGDILLEVNGVSLRHCSHARAVDILRETGSTVKLLIHRPHPPTPSLPSSSKSTSSSSSSSSKLPPPPPTQPPPQSSSSSSSAAAAACVKNIQSSSFHSDNYPDKELQHHVLVHVDAIVPPPPLYMNGDDYDEEIAMAMKSTIDQEETLKNPLSFCPPSPPSPPPPPSLPPIVILPSSSSSPSSSLLPYPPSPPILHSLLYNHNKVSSSSQSPQSVKSSTTTTTVRRVSLTRGPTGLGFTLKELNDSNSGGGNGGGLVVAGLMPGSAVWNSDVRKGDRLIALNDVPLNEMSLACVEESLSAVRIGDMVTLTLET